MRIVITILLVGLALGQQQGTPVDYLKELQQLMKAKVKDEGKIQNRQHQVDYSDSYDDEITFSLASDSYDSYDEGTSDGDYSYSEGIQEETLPNKIEPQQQSPPAQAPIPAQQKVPKQKQKVQPPETTLEAFMGQTPQNVQSPQMLMQDSDEYYSDYDEDDTSDYSGDQIDQQQQLANQNAVNEMAKQQEIQQMQLKKQQEEKQKLQEQQRQAAIEQQKQLEQQKLQKRKQAEQQKEQKRLQEQQKLVEQQRQLEQQRLMEQQKLQQQQNLVESQQNLQNNQVLAQVKEQAQEQQRKKKHRQHKQQVIAPNAYENIKEVFEIQQNVMPKPHSVETPPLDIFEIHDKQQTETQQPIQRNEESFDLDLKDKQKLLEAQMLQVKGQTEKTKRTKHHHSHHAVQKEAEFDQREKYILEQIQNQDKLQFIQFQQQQQQTHNVQPAFIILDAKRQEEIDKEKKVQEYQQQIRILSEEFNQAKQALIEKQKQQAEAEAIASAKPQPDFEGWILCENSSNIALASVCNLCQSTHAYQLDEENWYMIGIHHGYKKEFNVLLDAVKQYLGEGQLYLSFSNERQICLSAQGMKQDIDVKQGLFYFTGQGLESLLSKNQLFSMNAQASVEHFQFKATYSQNVKRFSYSNFTITLMTNIEHSLHQGQIIRCNSIRLNLDKNQIQYNGYVRVGSENLRFQLTHQNQDEFAEMIIENILVPDYKPVLMDISDIYFGNYFKEAIEKHMKSNQISQKSYRADLVIETIANDKKFSIKFALKRKQQEK